jgi:hypothetical protein
VTLKQTECPGTDGWHRKRGAGLHRRPSLKFGRLVQALVVKDVL